MRQRRTTFAMLAALAGCLSLLLACGTESPLYESTPEKIRMGSLYYAQAGCARCHGGNWDGKGEEAALLARDRGLKVTDFRSMSDPEKTVVDYFKVITAGTPKMTTHAYHQYTDAGRWAMAHFLHSLAPRLKDKQAEQRSEATLREKQEAALAYSKAAKQGHRRWQFGFQPVGARAQTPALSGLVKGTELAAEPSRGARSDSELAALNEATGRGKALYLASCAECHGATGAGAPSGVNLGSVDCKQPGRTKCAVTASASDIRARRGQFAAAHQGSGNTVLPSFLALGADDLDEIFSYLRAAK